MGQDPCKTPGTEQIFCKFEEGMPTIEPVIPLFVPDKVQLIIEH